MKPKRRLSLKEAGSEVASSISSASDNVRIHEVAYIPRRAGQHGDVRYVRFSQDESICEFSLSFDSTSPNGYSGYSYDLARQTLATQSRARCEKDLLSRLFEGTLVYYALSEDNSLALTWSYPGKEWTGKPSLSLWDRNRGEKVMDYTRFGDERLTVLAMSHSTKLAAAGFRRSNDHVHVKVFDLYEDRLIEGYPHEYHASDSRLCFSSDDGYLLHSRPVTQTSRDTETTVVCQLGIGQIFGAIGLDFAHFVPGRSWIIGRDDGFTVYDFASGACIYHLEEIKNRFYRMTLSPSGRYLATWRYTNNATDLLRIWKFER